MKNLLLTILVIGMGLGISCTQTRSKVDESNSLKIGGIYLIENGDGSYGAVKLIAFEDSIVHLKIYSNMFNEKPNDLSKVYLHELIGHTPLAEKGFLSTNPALLRVEKVEDSELEGYRLYLKKINK